MATRNYLLVFVSRSGNTVSTESFNTRKAANKARPVQFGSGDYVMTRAQFDKFMTKNSDLIQL